MRWAMILAVGLFVAGCAGEDPVDFQADPASVTPPESPNWALAAPREATITAEPTHEVPIFATGVEELLGYLDAVVLAEDRVEAMETTWESDGPVRAYIQRSAIFRFPDVISVVAVDLGAGDAGQRASLLIYSRSIYGHSDFDVNAERVARWLERLAEVAPVVAGRGDGD